MAAVREAARWSMIRHRLRRAVLAVVTVAVSTSCVYYNGMYNAQALADAGDARLRRDAEDDARAQFQQSAARAETVLVRFPDSPWRTRALYLAGRGAALAGECEQGTRRLEEALAGDGVTIAERDRAKLALASCAIRTSRVAEARARLDTLLRATDPETARQARLWAARAALAQGDLTAVTTYLAGMESGTLPWELVGAALNTGVLAPVESLLVDRARRGDYRDDAIRAVRELAIAGRFPEAERVVRAFTNAKVRPQARAALHFALGDQWLRAGDDTIALRHLHATRELAGRDTTLTGEAGARIGYLGLRRATSLTSADSAWSRMDSVSRRTSLARRLDEQLLLVRVLTARDEATGAGAYLAAEVARDSLRAPWLAAAMFAQLASTRPEAPVAPMAWYAASLLRPDSAESWQRRVRAQYGFSAVAARLQGDDPATRPDFVATPELLKFAWSDGVRIWSDSVRRLRTRTTLSGRPTPP